MDDELDLIKRVSHLEREVFSLNSGMASLSKRIEDLRPLVAEHEKALNHLKIDFYRGVVPAIVGGGVVILLYEIFN